VRQHCRAPSVIQSGTSNNQGAKTRSDRAFLDTRVIAAKRKVCLRATRPFGASGVAAPIFLPSIRSPVRPRSPALLRIPDSSGRFQALESGIFFWNRSVADSTPGLPLSGALD